MARIRDAAEIQAENILAKIAYLAGEQPTGKTEVRLKPLSKAEFQRRLRLIRQQAREVEARMKQAS